MKIPSASFRRTGPGSSVNVLVFFFSLLTATITSSQSVDCDDFDSCSSCVGAGSACIWCATAVTARCMPASSSTSCPPSSVVNPLTTTEVNNRPLDENNQVSVRTVLMKLRVGQPQTFSVSVKVADNFPLDLYMLMDLSASFSGDLNTVKAIAPQIVSAVGSLTSRFQVGFGTFVDKVTAPFNAPKALGLRHVAGGEPSACPNMPCSRPISFEHVVNLTNSTDLFSQSLQDIVISTSSDDLEGTLDAMMQAVVCTNVVGWREEARKVLLVMTDDLMHTAGDGRLAGIYRPNDARCRTKFDPTENKTLYSASRDYDYPTVEQMRMVLEQFGVVPVFATSAQRQYFNNIAQRFSGFAEELSMNADNLVNVIDLTYNQLLNSSRLEFPVRDYLQVNINADCPTGSIATSGNGCSGIGKGIVNFSVNVTLTRCPSTSVQENITVFVRPAFGTFTIMLDGHCSCDCEKEAQANSQFCTNNGNLTCGKCLCSDEWTGDNCSCSTAPCSSTPSLCNGRGTCECGKCVCDPPLNMYPGVDVPLFYGDNCECDNFRCLEGSNQKICSGQGSCQCDGTCDCRISQFGIPYDGQACDCDPANCVPQNGQCGATQDCTVVCNGQGTCRPCDTNNPCTCNATHTGKFCEMTIPDNDCELTDDLTQCVTCLGQNRSDCQDCNQYILATSLSSETTTCSFSSELCTYAYEITVIDDTIMYRVQPRSCFPIPIWGIVILIVLVIIIIGIVILVIIRVIIWCYDRMEYQRFKRNVAITDLTKNQNPLYVSPETKYTNVTYKE